MIAIIASVLLAVYVFIPVVLFDKVLSAFVPAKRVARSKTEEIAFGLIVAAIPLFAAFVLAHLCWFVGHYPFPLNESAEASAGHDYKIVLVALQSDAYLLHNQVPVWTAVEHIKWRQLRFLTWTYSILALECSIFTVLVYFYGSLRKFGIYRAFSRVFIQRVSEWHVLLTDYTFDRSAKRIVQVDVLTRSGLYSGIVEKGSYFTKPNGSLSGLLLKEAKRYRRSELQEDRKNGCAKATDAYWTAIAGPGQFYIPVEDISNLNIRYVISEEALSKTLQQQTLSLESIKAILAELGKTTVKVQVKSPPAPPTNDPQ